MTVTFSEAALERIARCAAVQTPSRGPVATALTDSFLQRTSEVHSFFPSVWAAFQRFTTLLELGVSAGYVDLDDLQTTDLHQAVSALSNSAWPDSTAILVRELSERLDGTAPRRIETLDPSAFHGYAAFLALTEEVFQDDEFLEFTRPNAWRQAQWEEDDLHFLLSPGHFAEALVTGRVAGLDAAAAATGLRGIRYFADLAELESRFNSVEGLFDKALRQASWAHGIAQFEARVKFWADKSAGWSPVGNDRHDVRQAVALLGKLASLRERLIALDLAHAVTHRVPSPQHTEALVESGQLGAARAALIEQIAGVKSTFSMLGTDWLLKLDEYIALCLRLAEIDPHAAATRLSAIESGLDHAKQPEHRSRARAVLAQARLAFTTGAAMPFTNDGLGTGPASTLFPTTTRQLFPRKENE